MRRTIPIFYSTLLLTAVNLLLRLAGTIFQVYLSGQIGPAGIGLLQLVMSVGSLAMIAGIAGVRTASMYLTAGELGRGKPQNISAMLSGCFRYSLLCSGLVGAALFLFAPLIARNWIGNAGTVDALRLFAVFLPVSCFCAVMTGYFTAANRIGTLAAVEVGEQLCSIGLAMALLKLWAGQDAARACLCVILGSGISTCITLLVLSGLRIMEHPPRSKPIAVMKSLTAVAVPLALADILKSGINTAENLMVPKRLVKNPGIADPLAAFGLVGGMVFPVLMFPACILFALAELLIPQLARCSASGSHARIQYLVKRSLKVAMLYGFLLGGMMYLLAEELCMALYSSAEAGHWLKRYALLIPMLYCDAITDAMTKGLGQQKVCVAFNILTSFLDVLFLFLWLPKYGMEGYFVSFFLTHLLNFVLSLGRLLKISKAAIPLRIPVLGAICTAVCILVSGILPSPVLRAAVFSILLVCSLYLTGILQEDDLHWIKGLIRRA